MLGTSRFLGFVIDIYYVTFLVLGGIKNAFGVSLYQVSNLYFVVDL